MSLNSSNIGGEPFIDYIVYFAKGGLSDQFKVLTSSTSGFNSINTKDFSNLKLIQGV